MPKFLMIKMHDNRKIITYFQYLPVVEKFLKKFECEAFAIQAPSNTKAADINKLAKFICDPTIDMQLDNYEIKSEVYPKNKSSKKTNLIKEHIKNILLSNEVLTIKKIKEKYKVSDTTIYNQLKNVKTQLENENKNIIKIGAGKYCIYQTTN